MVIFHYFSGLIPNSISLLELRKEEECSIPTLLFQLILFIFGKNRTPIPSNSSILPQPNRSIEITQSLLTKPQIRLCSQKGLRKLVFLCRTQDRKPSILEGIYAFVTIISKEQLFFRILFCKQNCVGNNIKLVFIDYAKKIIFS